jgi:hypothetical protein
MILFAVEQKNTVAAHRKVRNMVTRRREQPVKAAEILKTPGPSAAVISLIIECGENTSSADVCTYT